MTRLLFSILLLLSSPALADITAALWARATPPGGSSGAVYGRFENSADVDLKVESVELAFARHAMIHRTVYVDGMARMRHGDLEVPAGGTAELAPDGLHIMLMGLQHPLRSGCAYSLSLTWNDGSTSSHQVETGGIGQLVAPESEANPCP